MQIFVPVMGDHDNNNLCQNVSTAFSPGFYIDFLGWVNVKAKIGVMSMCCECPDTPFELFMKTGDVSVAVLPLQAASRC